MCSSGRPRSSRRCRNRSPSATLAARWEPAAGLLCRCSNSLTFGGSRVEPTTARERWFDRKNRRVRETLMDFKKLLQTWPVYRQLAGEDSLGRGKVAHSVCPFCAVGCAQKVYVTDDKVVQIEGNPDSPISRGRLCPKGSASKQLVTGPQRLTKVRYRPPYATEWQELDLETAMDMVADRVVDARSKGWQQFDADRNTLRRTMGIASLGGATLDNEENYLIKKLFTALGALQIENQARI